MKSNLDSLIYLADDHPANVALLETILAKAGYSQVVSFGNGSALLAGVTLREPDLILLDLQMPVMDGYGVLDALHSEANPAGYLPVVVMTADATHAARDRALSSGAQDFVTKPFDQGEVLLRVRNLLETRRAHQELRAYNLELKDEVASTAQTLANREQEWAEQAAALSHLEAQATAEATAQAICDELSRMAGLTSALVVALDAAGHAVPLARDISVDVRIKVNSPLPDELVAGWAERVGAGPWVGPWDAGFGSSLRRVVGELPTAMAIIPLRTSAALLGAIVVCTQSPDGIPYLARRLPVLESFGAVASALLAPGILARQRRGEVRGELEQVLARMAFDPVFQRIVDLQSGEAVGYEALTRFHDGTRPDRRFADADAVGLGLELEQACLSEAIVQSVALPGGWLSLNVSPDLLIERSRLQACLRDARRPAVLEVTEHVPIEDYPAFRAAVASFGSDVRVSVDDAGAGFASFRHILELRPDFVKLDIGLVRDIDHDDIRQALVAGIVYFARKSGCVLIAEGIETSGELDQLRALRVDLGQGYLLGRPARVIRNQAGSSTSIATGAHRSHPGRLQPERTAEVVGHGADAGPGSGG
ncbi:MAG TPA: EAL domain-containing response regulator [Candidatus Limnocylindrales bacterium]|nr:EAL domain-containing response regulator [Candidatus Limnocylindrales bacterium]